MASVNELRALALKRTKAAGSKISRLRKQGVEAAGTEFDPRVSRERIARMNKRQLAAYMGRVDSFTNRNVKFVAGANGAPLPKHLVAQYQSAERRRNERLSKRGMVGADVIVPGSGMTVGQRQKLMESRGNDILRAGGQWDYQPYTPHTRKIEGMANANALRKLIELERTTGRASNLQESLAVQKSRHVDWLLENGQTEMADMANSLSLDQFDLLKHKTGYAHQIKFMYMGTEDADESVAATMRDDNLSDARELLKWARSIDPNTGYANAPYAQRYKQG